MRASNAPAASTVPLRKVDEMRPCVRKTNCDRREYCDACRHFSVRAAQQLVCRKRTIGTLPPLSKLRRISRQDNSTQQPVTREIPIACRRLQPTSKKRPRSLAIRQHDDNAPPHAASNCSSRVQSDLLPANSAPNRSCRDGISKNGWVQLLAYVLPKTAVSSEGIEVG
jgi:hypothetical protein